MAEKEYTIEELTHELGVCKMTAYKLVRSGRIKARKRYGTTNRGDYWLVSQSALDEYKSIKESNICIPQFSWVTSINRPEIITNIVLCSNCNNILLGLSYDKSEYKEGEEKEIIDKILMGICPKCKAKIKK